LSLKFLVTYLKKHSLDIFAYYRLCLAALLLLSSYY
jgi:undecaprenyl pyrophosphate phosphatase UppP